MRDEDFSDNKERYYKRKFYSGYVDDEVTYYFDYIFEKSYLPGFLFSRRRVLPHLLIFGVSYEGGTKKSFMLTLMTSFFFNIFWLFPLYFTYYMIVVNTGIINLFPPLIRIISNFIPLIIFFIGDYIMMPRLVEIESYRRLMDRFILRKLVSCNKDSLDSRNPSSKFHKSNN
jgi:hypothetical protein